MAPFGGGRHGWGGGQGPEPEAANAEALPDGANALAALGTLEGPLGDAGLAGGSEDGASRQLVALAEDLAQELAGLLLGTGIVGLGLGCQEVVGGEAGGPLPDEGAAVEAVAESGAGGGEVGLEVDQSVAGGVVWARAGRR